MQFLTANHVLKQYKGDELRDLLCNALIFRKPIMPILDIAFLIEKAGGNSHGSNRESPVDTIIDNGSFSK